MISEKNILYKDPVLGSQNIELLFPDKKIFFIIVDIFLFFTYNIIDVVLGFYRF